MSGRPLTLDFTLLKSASLPRRAFGRADLKALAAFALAAEGVSGAAQVTVDLTGHERIQALNRRFRGVDRTTDVISFRHDSGKGAPLEGDLAINVAQAEIQAASVRHSVRREVRLLLIHGILHLLGYTDYEPAPRRRMFKRQNRLLRRWESRAGR